MNSAAPTTHTDQYYRENPIVLTTRHQRMVYKYDIANALNCCTRFDRMMRTLLDSDPDFAQEMEKEKGKRWVSIELAEKIVLRWIGHPEARVSFQAAPPTRRKQKRHRQRVEPLGQP